MPSLLVASTFLDPSEAVNFVANVLEASTEYSIIGKDLQGKILLWNEGARRIYGYEAAEVVGKLNSDILHDPAEVVDGLPLRMRSVALTEGKWEGTVTRRRRDGGLFTARVVLTPRRNIQGEAIGFLLISKDMGSATLERALAAGFDDFYPMPIEPRDFVARIEPFLGRGETAGEPAGGSP